MHYSDLPIHKSASALSLKGVHMQGWQCCVGAGLRDLAVLGHQQKALGTSTESWLAAIAHRMEGMFA